MKEIARQCDEKTNEIKDMTLNRTKMSKEELRSTNELIRSAISHGCDCAAFALTLAVDANKGVH